LIGRYACGSSPDLSDLIMDRAAEFLAQALNFLPSLGAVLAFECGDIDRAKRAEEKNEAKEKLAHA